MNLKIRNITDFLYQKRNIILIALLIFLVISIALTSIYPNAYFLPINGSYQNYNVVRRLLDGQIPYKDFVVYLGPMHLYLGTFFTWLFGGKFISSVFAFNLLTLLTFVFICFIITKSLKYKFSESIIGTIIAVILGFLIFKTLKFDFSILYSIFREFVTVNNSARLIRLFILPLACLFIMLTDKKVENEKWKNILYGVIAGFAFPCSNDFGVSTSAAIIFIFLLSLFFNKKRKSNILQSILSFSCGFLTSLFSTILIFSMGHPIDWFRSMSGVSLYQGWYYIGDKTTYIYDANLTFMALLQLLFSFSMIYKLFKTQNNNGEKNDIQKYKILGILNLACAITTQELNYFGDGTYILPMGIMILTIFFYSKDFVKNLISQYLFSNYNFTKNINVEKSLALFLILIIPFFCIYNLKICTKKTDIPPIKELSITKRGGFLSDYSIDILDAKKFIRDKKIFSTYASALEDVTNQFQPSGFDYIIHVLGDNARNRYLKSFIKGDFSYVSIQKPLSSKFWENWVQRANWFFYRELYKSYIPVYKNDYLVIFDKNKNKDINILPESTVVEYKPDSNHSGLISLKTDKNITGIADLEIDFNLKKRNIISKLFIYKKLLKVYDSDLYWDPGYQKINYIYLSSTCPQIIPIPIVNGKGYLYVDTIPNHNIALNIKALKTKYYYTTPFKYIEILGINYDKNEILLANTVLNKTLIKDCKKIKINNIIYNIENINNIWDIMLEVDKPIPHGDNYFIEIIE